MGEEQQQATPTPVPIILTNNNKWEPLLPFTLNPYSPPSSSPLQILSPPSQDDVTIFPPNNHEGLPITPALHAPLSVDFPPSPSSPTPPLPPPNNNNNNTQLLKLFDFALYFINSKLHSFLSSFFSSFRPVLGLSFLAVVLFWFRRRKQRITGAGSIDSVGHLKQLIQQKDEKIIQLLEQISQMNKVLLARYRIPVLKASCT